ncbi:MAG: hypothetical protein QMD66_03830 [Actinomycetota bacterium]|nr:hypothetical protein [Actinomycetota bacterium]
MGSRNTFLVIVLIAVMIYAATSWALAQTQIDAVTREHVLASATEGGPGTTHEPEAKEAHEEHEETHKKEAHGQPEAGEQGAEEHETAGHGTAEHGGEHEATPTGWLLSFSDIFLLGMIVIMLIVISKGLGMWGAKREAKD